jgi:hypothetical protein
MDSVNVVKLEPQVKTRKHRRTRPVKARHSVSARMLRRLKLQHGVAGVIGLIAAAMTTVSLSHIAGGIAVITHGAVPDWQAWGCAIGLDANYIAMEMAGVVAAMQHVRDRLRRLTRYGIPAVMAFSMSLNALEFAAGTTNSWELAAGIAMGVILPALVFLTFRVATLADV